MSIFLQQLPNFPAFTWSPDILNPILMRVRLKQGKLLASMETLQPEFKAQAHNEIMRLEVVSNLQIENQVELEKKEALRIIYSNPINTDLNLERLNELYKALSALFNYQVVDNQQFSSGFDKKKLDQFLTWFNKPGLDRLLKAGIAHLWFLSIAPFEKGAGVIARIISDIQLAKADGIPHRYYSMSDQISKKKNEYQFILSQAQQGSLDITIWLQWYLHCLEGAYEHAETALAPIVKRANFWNTQNGNSFNKRQQVIINKLLTGFNEGLTTTIYACIAECSRDTALRDVTDLLRRDIFSKEGGLGKNTRYKIKLK
jgi:Fic family protein